MSSSGLHDPKDSQWTVRVHGHAAGGASALLVDGCDLMPLVARLLADARVHDLVVRPRIREIRAHVAASATAPRGK